MVDTPLLIATSNSGKIHEIRQLLAGVSQPLLFLSDLPTKILEPEETGESFSQNAQLKAHYYAQLSGLATIADDSGLSVLELDGFPGVNSARWIGGSDEDRVAGLLTLLTDRGLTEPISRRAYFTCIVSLAQPDDQKTIDFEGECWGTLSHVPLGNDGFGYDPIFIPDGYDETMAQLGTTEKNKISARSIAIKKFRQWLIQH